MTLDNPGYGSDDKTCLCCMCRCGDHRCYEQNMSKLPLSMQLELKSKEVGPQKRYDKKPTAYQADLYRKSTYRKDFCEQLDRIDRFPLEHKKLETNLQLHRGDFTRESTYRDDYIPWSKGDQERCRAKLHVPDYMLERIPEQGYGQKSTHEIPGELYNYYCPPHCLEVGKEETKENCLKDYRKKFNTGPHVQFAESIPERPRQPFEKFTNYMLDYKGSQLPPRPEKRNGLKVETLPRPMASETSYRSAFTCPPENRFFQDPRDAKDYRSSLKVGDGPMQGDSTAMLDYQDPDVSTHQPERPPREVYKPPYCRMESTTTTGSAYPKWKVIPNQPKPAKYVDTDYSQKQQGDVLRLVTTYQEDFDGLKSALCPCKLVENYGPKFVNPRYYYTESDREHDFFGYNRKISERMNEFCPHSY